MLERVTFAAGPNPTNSGANPTRTVTWTVNDGSSASAPVTTTIALPAAPFDVNGDGISDLEFQNNGTPGIWLWNGSAPTAETGLPRAIADYIAGMTDRYAIREHRRLFTVEEA